jgi:hypothetical protein
MQDGLRRRDTVSHQERRFLRILVVVGIVAVTLIVFGSHYLGIWDCARCDGKEQAKAIVDTRTVLVQLLLAFGTGGTHVIIGVRWMRQIKPKEAIADLLAVGRRFAGSMRLARLA